jgi:putative transposase
MLERLRVIFGETLEKWEGSLVEFNGEADHVHLLISVNPKVQPSKLVNNLKTVSSRLIRKEFAEYLGKVYRKPVFWSRSYCIISCGGAPISVLKQYIQQQTEID